MIRTYKNFTIYPCEYNASGMRYYAHTNNGTLRADTLQGIKNLINNHLLKESK